MSVLLERTQPYYVRVSGEQVTLAEPTDNACGANMPLFLGLSSVGKEAR